MSGAEIRWRLNGATRNTIHRVLARVRDPQWNRRALARALASGPQFDAVRAALHAGRWMDAHGALARTIVESEARFPIAPAMRADLVASITAAFPEASRDAAVRADRILAGEFDLLGYRALRFDSARGSSPDWHLDPVHDRRPPRVFWSSVPFLDAACGDHKIVWELNRHQHLQVLGRAYWLTGDVRYRQGALAHLSAWIEANPPLVGINWASMLELAFRALSWTWAIHFFAGQSDQDREPWLVDGLLALDRQLRHVNQNLSHYFSPNTHLLGEALALYVAGTSLPFLASSERYAATGRRVLIEQLERQVAPDGGHLERSTHYHRYTLDFYLLALVVARITGDAAAPIFEEAVARLASAAQLLADSHGRLPHIGDDDGGMLLPICDRELDDVRDSLAEAGALLGRPDLSAWPIPEEAHWMLSHPLLRAQLERARAVPAGGNVGSAALPDTGYYVSRSPAGDHLIVDAGAHGYENGGHAHADALSMTFSVRGVPLLIDPGTGSYTADPHARDTFRSSMLHNTLVVDGRSQSVPSGPFHWAHAAQAHAHVWRANPGFDYLEATHDGYAPLEHRRHVLVLHGDLLVVADLVSGDGAHDVQVHWHLDPRWTVEVSGRRTLLRSAGERVELAVSRGAVEHVHGDDTLGIGWHAPVYGRLERTSAVRVSESGNTPLWVVTIFGMNPGNEVLAVESLPVWAEAGMLERGIGVRIARQHSVDFVGFASTSRHRGDADTTHDSRTWRFAGFETDARMLFCRTSDHLSRLALVDGSLVRAADRRALYVQMPREVPDLYLDLTQRQDGQTTNDEMTRLQPCVE